MSTAAAPPSPAIEVLLFDLGGVLVDFGGAEGLNALLPTPLPLADLEERWLRCRHSLAFGCGSLDTTAFADGFMREWGITLPREAFLTAYTSWAVGLLPGACQLLDELRPRYRLAALSNSNPLHWARLTDLGIDALFEVALSSHQVGHRKPAPEMYAAALSRLGVPAASVFFLDDAQGNVDAARGLGLQGARACGVDGVRQALAAHGL